MSETNHQSHQLTNEACFARESQSVRRKSTKALHTERSQMGMAWKAVKFDEEVEIRREWVECRVTGRVLQEKREGCFEGVMQRQTTIGNSGSVCSLPAGEQWGNFGNICLLDSRLKLWRMLCWHPLYKRNISTRCKLSNKLTYSYFVQCLHGWARQEPILQSSNLQHFCNYTPGAWMTSW